MAVLPILRFGNPILRRKCGEVRELDRATQRLIDDMLDTMRAAMGVGLAAPQVGRLLRVIVIELPGEKEIVLINPEIVTRKGRRLVEEGCLSYPGWRGKVLRSVEVEVRGFDRKGEERRIAATDLLAQALEHEIDHLEGVLFIDRLRSPKDLYRIGAKRKEDEAL